MKKTFFNPADLHFRQYLPAMGSRRIFGSSGDGRGSASYRSGGGDDGGDDDDDDDDDGGDDVTKEQRSLLRIIQKRVTRQLRGAATAKEVKDIVDGMKDLKELPVAELRELADKDKGVTKQLVEQGLAIKKLQENITERGKDMSLRGQIKTWMEENKDELAAIKSGSKRELKPMELRVVASPMHVSTVNPTGSPFITRTEVESGINDILRYPNTFWDYVTKGRTNAPTYVWVNKTNLQGAAAFIGPGVAKPPISFEFVAENSIAKKVADSAKAGTELLEDIDGMTTFIEQELRAAVMLKVNEVLMTGISSSTSPAGIKTLSQNFAFYTTAAAGINVTNPNYMDALRAVVAALRSGKLTGEITIFINPIDSANMDMAKATTSGLYLLPPFTSQNNKNVSGATVVEDPLIPVGYFQAGFLQYYRILIYKDFVATWGWENDDFTKNLVTAVGEMRLHQFVNSIHTGAFMYDSFANVITAITA